MIEGIEEVGAEVERVLLVKFDVLHDGHIPVRLEWPAERIPWSISISGGIRRVCGIGHVRSQ